MEDVHHRKKVSALCWKLLCDPELKKGFKKQFRFDGVVPGNDILSVKNVHDPRTPRLLRSESHDFPIPLFKIDGNYVGHPPAKEVTFTELNDNVSERFLTDLCAKFGTVEKVTILHNPKSKRHLGIATVVFLKPRSAKQCIDKHNDASIMGRRVSVFLDPFGKIAEQLYKDAVTVKAETSHDTKLVKEEAQADESPVDIDALLNDSNDSIAAPSYEPLDSVALEEFCPEAPSFEPLEVTSSSSQADQSSSWSTNCAASFPGYSSSDVHLPTANPGLTTPFHCSASAPFMDPSFPRPPQPAAPVRLPVPGCIPPLFPPQSTSYAQQQWYVNTVPQIHIGSATYCEPVSAIPENLAVPGAAMPNPVLNPYPGSCVAPLVGPFSNFPIVERQQQHNNFRPNRGRDGFGGRNKGRGNNQFRASNEKTANYDSTRNQMRQLFAADNSGCGSVNQEEAAEVDLQSTSYSNHNNNINRFNERSTRWSRPDSVDSPCSSNHDRESSTMDKKYSSSKKYPRERRTSPDDRKQDSFGRRSRHHRRSPSRIYDSHPHEKGLVESYEEKYYRRKCYTPTARSESSKGSERKSESREGYYEEYKKVVRRKYVPANSSERSKGNADAYEERSHHRSRERRRHRSGSRSFQARTDSSSSDTDNKRSRQRRRSMSASSEDCSQRGRRSQKDRQQRTRKRSGTGSPTVAANFKELSPSTKEIPLPISQGKSPSKSAERPCKAKDKEKDVDSDEMENLERDLAVKQTFLERSMHKSSSTNILLSSTILNSPRQSSTAAASQSPSDLKLRVRVESETSRSLESRIQALLTVKPNDEENAIPEIGAVRSEDALRPSSVNLAVKDQVSVNTPSSSDNRELIIEKEPDFVEPVCSTVSTSTVSLGAVCDPSILENMANSEDFSAQDKQKMKEIGEMIVTFMASNRPMTQQIPFPPSMPLPAPPSFAQYFYHAQSLHYGYAGFGYSFPFADPSFGTVAADVSECSEVAPNEDAGSKRFRSAVDECLNTVVDQVKQVLQKDINKRFTDTIALSAFEKWFDAEEQRFMAKKGNDFESKNTSPQKTAEVQQTSPSSRTESISAVLNRLFDSKSDDSWQLGRGLKSALPKLPSFKKKLVLPSKKARDSESESECEVEKKLSEPSRSSSSLDNASRPEFLASSSSVKKTMHRKSRWSTSSDSDEAETEHEESKTGEALVRSENLEDINSEESESETGGTWPTSKLLHAEPVESEATEETEFETVSEAEGPARESDAEEESEESDGGEQAESIPSSSSEEEAEEEQEMEGNDEVSSVYSAAAVAAEEDEISDEDKGTAQRSNSDIPEKPVPAKIDENVLDSKRTGPQTISLSPSQKSEPSEPMILNTPEEYDPLLCDHRYFALFVKEPEPLKDSNVVVNEPILVAKLKGKIIEPIRQHKRTFPDRDPMQEWYLLFSYMNEGLDYEDIMYLKDTYEDMLQDGSVESKKWLHETHWCDPPQLAPLSSSSPKSKRRKLSGDSQKHKTGCARTEGYYKLTRKEKKNKSHFARRVETLKETEANRAKQQLSNTREARSMHRKILSAFDDVESDLLKFNQLKFRKKLLRFGKSVIHNWGLFAEQDIAADEMIVEYVGQKVRGNVAERREKAYEKMGIGSSYLFRMDGEAVIDATKMGNLARFMNHSCNPNCYAKIISANGEKKIVIYSKEEIKANEEITYDYKFPLEEEKIPCNCGSINCRGSLN